jgi:heme-degrading monooxygenase HmoA
MISRHWIGIVKKDRVDDYLAHLEKTVFPNLAKTEGLRNSYYLKRPVKEGVEFLIVTEWDSVEAIKTFAGKDYDKSVVDPYAKEMMVSYDKNVRHYTI